MREASLDLERLKAELDRVNPESVEKSITKLLPAIVTREANFSFLTKLSDLCGKLNINSSGLADKLTRMIQTIRGIHEGSRTKLVNLADLSNEVSEKLKEKLIVPLKDGIEKFIKPFVEARRSIDLVLENTKTNPNY